MAKGLLRIHSRLASSRGLSDDLTAGVTAPATLHVGDLDSFDFTPTLCSTLQSAESAKRYNLLRAYLDSALSCCQPEKRHKLGPRFHVELRKDGLQLGLHGAKTLAESLSDLAVPKSIRDQFGNLAFGDGQ